MDTEDAGLRSMIVPYLHVHKSTVRTFVHRKCRRRMQWQKYITGALFHDPPAKAEPFSQEGCYHAAPASYFPPYVNSVWVSSSSFGHALDSEARTFAEKEKYKNLWRNCQPWICAMASHKCMAFVLVNLFQEGEGIPSWSQEGYFRDLCSWRDGNKASLPASSAWGLGRST